MVGHASLRQETLSVFEHLDALERKLDEFEKDDTCVAEGWRRAFDVPE
jgi:hypothetical protein